MRKDFIEWYQSHNEISMYAKSRLNLILSIPFKVGENTVKDYIKNPRLNGYQSLHFSLLVACYSETLSGFHVEFQLRDTNMHQNAEVGSASHIKYKDETDALIRNVFHFDDCSKLKLPGFTDYEKWDEDRDGLHYAKHFADIRSS
jgi:hypothetical protein